MPKPLAYAAEFRLIDPFKLASTGSVEASTVLRITGLIQGRSADMDRLNARDASRLANNNIVRLTHFKTHAERIHREVARQIVAEAEGTLLCYYCARCGRRFQSNDECKKCGVPFHITSEMDRMLASRMPGIPAKVVAYVVQQLKHRFVIAPPRA
jgi:hypothetical protein